MFPSHVLMLLGGIIIGCIFMQMTDFYRKTKPRLKEYKPIIHMRGHKPAWFAKFYCEKRHCEALFEDGWHARYACYVDQDGHYWCEHHLPASTKVAERAALEPTEDGRCVTHDYKCPKPWEPY